MLLGTNMCNGHVNGVKLFTETSDLDKIIKSFIGNIGDCHSCRQFLDLHQ